MPLGAPIIYRRTFLDRLREAFMPTPPRVAPSEALAYQRISNIIAVPGNSITKLLSDKATFPHSLLLESYIVLSLDQTGKDFIKIIFTIDGVEIFPVSGNRLWVLTSAQPISLNILVPTGKTWALLANNQSGTSGFVDSTDVNMQAAVFGKS